ncbi:MAG: permease [Candidatus Micrarchaeia archaeon]
MDLLSLLFAGITALQEYLLEHTLTCLIPAFFIAGAITVVISKESVLKYLGAKTKKRISYAVASIIGTILAVCSCTVLPLFAGIYKRGAGLGPAITFLFSGPAINLLAIIYSASLLGIDIGIARTVAAILLSIVIGLIMAYLFRNEKSKGDLSIGESKTKPTVQVVSFLSILILILVIGAAQIELTLKSFFLIVLLFALIVVLKIWYSKEEIKEWLSATWDLAKQLVPLLLIGVFIAGIITAIVPRELIENSVGGNSITSNLVASIFGAFMYFATLTEVPIVKSLMVLGMGKGPALALLLAGPSLSLPNMLVINKVLGLKKTVAYVFLVIIFSALAGFIFGML